MSQCYSLTTHESGDGRTAVGVSVKNNSDINWQLLLLPLPLLYLSPPSSCLIMLLCVCLSVCILCVKECVFLRSLCQCVCSSNTGFSPHYPPPPPLFFSPHFWWLHTHLLSISNQTLFMCLFSIIFELWHFSTLHLSRFLTTSSPLPSICPFIDPSIHLPPLVSSSQLPSSTPSSTFPLLLISGLSLLPFSSSLTLSTSFSSSSSSLPPFLSLFHTVLCASLSLAGLLLGGWEFVCTQVPAEHPLHPGSQPGSASLLLILLLLLLSLPFPPAISSPFTFLRPLHMTPHATLVRTAPTHPLTLLPPHLPLSFPPCWKHTALRFFSGAFSNSLCWKQNCSFTNCNWVLYNHVKSQFWHLN